MVNHHGEQVLLVLPSNRDAKRDPYALDREDRNANWRSGRNHIGLDLHERGAFFQYGSGHVLQRGRKRQGRRRSKGTVVRDALN